MSKVILVIGNVTEAQCEEARATVTQNGHRSKIVRADFKKFFITSGQLLEKYATSAEAALESRRADSDGSYDASTMLYGKLGERHYSSFGDIGAFVVDERTWNLWDLNELDGAIWIDHAREMQADYAPRWIACSDGRCEYVG